VQVQVVQLLLLLLLHLLLLLLLPHPAFRVSAGRQLQLEAPRFSPHRGDSRQPPQPAHGVSDGWQGVAAKAKAVWLLSPLLR
jgi:hypothetical protein